MGKRRFFQIFLFSLFFFLSAVVFLETGCREDEGYKDISPAELRSMLDDDETLMLIDVRTRPEYESGHIPGVKKLIPVDDLESRIGELEEFKKKDVVLQCRSGARSARASAILLKNGFKRVFNLQGGIEAYKNAGFKIEKNN